MRAEFQVIIIPYMIRNNEMLVAVFERKGKQYWQFISGGGINNESLKDAAKREFFEETSIEIHKDLFFKMDTVNSIPKIYFKEHCNKKNLYVIPEYTFYVKLLHNSLKLSEEHSKYVWVGIDKAYGLLRFDSNKTALWELSERYKCEKI
jgi:dihydroneopterin triphosphate diphosphatase